MSKQQQIVELQDLIDNLTRMKLNLQQQTGAATFSEVVTSYSSERSRTSFSDQGSDAGIGGSGGGAKQQRRANRDQLRQVRSSIDRLFNSFEQ